MSEENVAPWYRQFWCWFVIAPPLAGILLSASLVGIAAIHGDSMVVDDYDTVGRAIVKSYEREDRALRLGLGGRMILDHEQGIVTIRLDGLSNPPERVHLSLSHPTHAERDMVVDMQRNATGLYRGRLQGDINGRHYLRLEPDDEAWLLTMEIDADRQEFALTPARRGG